MRILLAEDEMALSKALVTILERNNYSVDPVYDGQAALAYAESGNYDGMVLDIMMPKMDGYKATCEIRNLQDKAKACIPIVAITANAFEEDKKMAMEAGMNGHISKPIDVNVLDDQIINIFKKVS